ncbi:MAG: matrixin family metalloprotease [Oligoflexia bacterium]|nr:matrixin family metalloprotease [Oligoflexia bacterium]
MKMKKSRLIFMLISLFCLLGFNTYLEKNGWDTSNESIDKQKLFVVFADGDSVIANNDLPVGDALYGVQNVTINQLMQSIFDDYNNVQGSYLLLVGVDDPDYNETNALFRTITISFDGADGTNGGQARFNYKDNKFRGCSIELEAKLKNSAWEFTGVITHEIGHCTGLDHPQDTVNSLMSYFYNGKYLRLMADDKMGLIYLYPENKSDSKETPTYGLSCQKR